MSLGNDIKTFRKKLGLTQEELASQLYVTSQAVSKWESENGLPDTAQIVPIAKALNVTTDSLFGMDSNTTDYDKEEAEKIKNKANELRDSTDSTSGAILAADYLDSECEKHPYNYEILMRYVQAVAHLSRFAEPMETSVEFCNWALNIIHALCKNPKLKPLSQGFYRDITQKNLHNQNCNTFCNT